MDYECRTVYIRGGPENDGDGLPSATRFDMLVVGMGAQNATFGMPTYLNHAKDC